MVIVPQLDAGALRMRRYYRHWGVFHDRNVFFTANVNDAQLGGWIGIAYAVVLVSVSVSRNRRMFIEQVGFTAGGVLAAQNILPPFKFIWFALTTNHAPLPLPLAGYEKYLLVAGIASEMVTLVSLYSLFVQALKVIPRS